MADITNVQVGVCEVTFNGVNLGHTKGGVEVSYEPNYHEVSVDKYGETMVDAYLVGEKLEAKVPLAEYTIDNIAVAIPQGAAAGAADARQTIGAVAGKQLSSVAAELVLHPINEGNRSRDIVFHKAAVMSQVVINHAVDEETIIEVTFRALLDETKADQNYLGMIGDSAA